MSLSTMATVVKPPSRLNSRHGEAVSLVRRVATSDRAPGVIASQVELLADCVRGESGQGWSIPPVVLWVPCEEESSPMVGFETKRATHGQWLSSLDMVIFAGALLVPLVQVELVEAVHVLHGAPEAYGVGRSDLDELSLSFELHWGLLPDEAAKIVADGSVGVVGVGAGGVGGELES